MIDTHCHLTDPRLLGQLGAVLQRASDSGVEKMITIGCEVNDDRAVIELCRSRPQLSCAIGVHPNYCHEASLEDIVTIESLAGEASVVALGEMGLDYFHKFAPVDRQRAFFEAQLDLASRLGMPVVIHSRDAVDDTLAVLRGFPTVAAVFHCFSGDWSQAKRILDRGYLIGIDGPVTFKNATALREAAKNTPRDRVVIETDAPYLTPEPMRKQKTNEPALVAHVLAMIAELWNLPVGEADRITTENAVRFFRLVQDS